MKIALIYSNKRAKFIASNLSKYADVIEIDLSDIELEPYAKIISSVFSFHFNRNNWQNDYSRNPFFLDYLYKIYTAHIRNKNIGSVDAILQVGVMFSCDYSILQSRKLFLYADGVYDPDNKFWLAFRFGEKFANMQKKIYESATLSFTFSNWARNQLNERYGIPLDKIVACGWGPCLPIPQHRVTKSGNPRRLIFIGYNPEIKGLDILLGAFRIVRKQFHDISLDIVGLENVFNFKLTEENIKYHGRCDKGEIIQLFDKTDVFILPSRYERSAHVILEAMFYGLPVITTNTCGTPEPVLSGQCGLVITPGSIPELVNAITKILQDPKGFHLMSENAVNEAFKNWSWEIVCRRIADNIKANI